MSVRNYLIDAFYSLGARINKRTGDITDDVAQGLVGPVLPDLDLKMDEEELVKLSDTWEKVWNDSEVKSKFDREGEENEKYWKGEHYDKPELDKRRSVKDNAIYEGLETYLPQVTRRNPEPMVSVARGEEQSEPNVAYAHAIQLELGEIADDLNLRLKLKGAARNHELRLLGALQIGWDLDEDRPSVEVVRPTKLILDPAAVTDEGGYRGNRLGKMRKEPAWKIIAMLEGVKGEQDVIDFVKETAKHELGSELQFVEWWTPDYVFWKMGSRVLMKRKNPHWNYDEEEPAQQPAEAQDGGATAENGGTEPTNGAEAAEPSPAGQEAPEGATEGAPAAPKPTPRKGVNHFKVRKMPFILMATMTLGNQPVNVTSNIGQNLSNQDLINKRIRQIDKTADSSIGGMVVSLARSGLTKDEARNVTTALRNNGVVAIPDGAPQEAVWKPPATELPVYVYNQLVDVRNRVRDIWGTRGSSPAGIEGEKTVRGKIIVQGLDTDRIGGGISEYLEQMADQAYNWLTQLLYVYDDRFVENIAKGVQIPRIKVTVKEGSLLPKDSTTIANQAIDLAQGGKMSLIDMYKRLDYPNPEELAANVWLEANAPEILFSGDQRVQQVIQQRQAAAGKGAEKPPAESINFKDLPPEGKAQMAAKVGIDLHPEGIAAHEQNKNGPPVPQLPVAAPSP